MIFTYKGQRVIASTRKEASALLGITEQELQLHGQQVRYEMRKEEPESHLPVGQGYDEQLSKWKDSRKNGDSHTSTKELVEQLKENQCAICGFDGVGRAKTFHHVEPSQKQFEIRVGRLRIEGLQAEVAKTILLCLNCHSVLHSILEDVTQDDASSVKRVKKFLKECEKLEKDKVYQMWASQKY